MELESTITCPHCGFEKSETVPDDYTFNIYICIKCGYVMHSENEECCILCAFGTRQCALSQRNNSLLVGNIVQDNKRKEKSFIEDVLMKMNVFTLPILCIVTGFLIFVNCTSVTNLDENGMCDYWQPGNMGHGSGHHMNGNGSQMM